VSQSRSHIAVRKSGSAVLEPTARRQWGPTVCSCPESFLNGKRFAPGAGDLGKGVVALASLRKRQRARPPFTKVLLTGLYWGTLSIFIEIVCYYPASGHRWHWEVVQPVSADPKSNNGNDKKVLINRS
jgi:hypothetical protein